MLGKKLGHKDKFKFVNILEYVFLDHLSQRLKVIYSDHPLSLVCR